MATDVSALGIKVTSTGVVKTTGELERFAKASNAARNAAKPINIKIGNSGLAKALADIQKLDRALRGVGGRGNASSARLNVTGGAAAIREINRFTKAVTDARAKVGGGITVKLQANGSAAAVKNIKEYEKAVNQAQSAASKGANFNMGAGSAGGVGGATTSIIGLSRAIMGLVAAFGVLTAGRFFAKVADESNLMAARLRLATVETGNFAQAQEDVRRIAASSRSDLDTTATLYGRILMSAKELGIAQRDAAKATETITKSFKVSGAATIEAENATRQLIQALQSGVLRGDEFRSVMEQAPRLARAIADGLDIPITKLRELAHEGKITTDVLLDAVIKANEEINKEFEGMPVTFSEAMGQIYNAAVVTFGAFDRGGEFSKSITSFVLGGTNDLEAMERAAEKLGQTIKAELAGVTAVFQGLADQVRTVKGWFDALANTGLGSWVGRVVDQLNTLSSYLNPIANALRFIRSVGAGARADELARQRAEMEGGFAGRYLDRFGDQLGGGQSAQAQAIAKTTEEKKKAKTASERLAERLAREAEATETLIRGNYEAAAAYRESTAAGKIAEVAAEARAKGIKARGEADAYAARELRKYVSEQAASVAESTAALREQTAAQVAVNKAVSSGSLNIEKASIALKNLIEQRKILNAIEVARRNNDAAGEKALTVALKDLTEQQIAANRALREYNDIVAADSVKRSIPQLQKEIELERKLGRERIKALRGLSGDSLENELARINNERERGGILLEYETKIAEARRLEQWKLVEALEAERDARLELLGVRHGQESDERTFEQNRRRAISASREMANIIGGSIGDAANAIMDAVDKFEQAFNKDVWGGLGEKFAGAFKVLEKMGAGAKVGTAVDGIFDAIGIKSSKTGAQIGGAVGQFAGPIGAIAGSIFGGVIGGMLKSTPRASATVSIIAGEAMDTAIKGSSGKLRKIAGGLADSVISGLSDIADQLGADLLGDANVSIGMRKKNYRVDPTGRGITKTSKGAIDFGDDQAAAIAYAIQVAIQQGVIGGLSESLERLITADGDLQRNLQKALSFQSVFDELHQRIDPQGFDLAQLDKWRAGMDKLFAEAGATAEELAKLEELTGLKRAEIVEKYAKEIAQAEGDARQIRQLEIEIMRLSGDTLGALAAERALEQEGMSAAVVELMKRRDALLDEAEAAQEAARAAEELAAQQRAIADERYSLEGQILDLLGDTAAIRARELEALDPSNRALLERIHALQDEAAAATAAARAAEELAARNKAIADEISGLDRQWLQLIGDVDKLRELQLGDLLSDDARDIQQRIWAEQDRQAAEEAARRAAEESARAAEQAAQAYARAIEEHNRAIEDARSRLAQAYERETGALRQTIETFRALGREIREFRQGLFAADNPALGYDQARAQFLNTSRMAGLGNEASLQRFTGDAQDFLDLARGRAGSLADYQREVAFVAREALKAERGAGGMVTEAQRQIRLMDEQVKGILDLNEKVATFTEELVAFQVLQARQIPTFTDTVSSSIEIVAESIEAAASAQEKRDVEAAKREEDAVRREETVIIALNRIERLLSRLETDDGLAVSFGGGSIPVTGSVDARVINTVGNPVPTKEVP